MKTLKKRRLGLVAAIAAVFGFAAFGPVQSGIDVELSETESYIPKQVIAKLGAGLVNITIIYKDDI